MSSSDFSIHDLLQAWKSQLALWSADGSLSAAAKKALLLNGEQNDLNLLVSRWSARNFDDLPPVVLLPAGSMPGAAGAYAISTGSIYLNQEWVRSASLEQATVVLTEELGHHLDGMLNASDTPGDEGAIFSNRLLRHNPRNKLANSEEELETGTIILSSNVIDAEFAATPGTISSTIINLAPVRILSRYGNPITNDRETIVLFHGWRGVGVLTPLYGWFDPDVSKLTNIGNSISPETQVLLVDWSWLAIDPLLPVPYFAAGNIRPVADWVVSVIGGISAKITLIGHSLGGIMAGEVSRILGSNRSDVVTLDVATPAQLYDLDFLSIAPEYAQPLNNVK
jgi:hypothetical protein